MLNAGKELVEREKKYIGKKRDKYEYMCPKKVGDVESRTHRKRRNDRSRCRQAGKDVSILSSRKTVLWAYLVAF